jgi:predicted ATP-dependent endonuclease of OLD family
MQHLLEKITLRNFRSIQNSDFLLSNYTALIGYNNAGKTNVLDGIKWLLRKTSLTESDFYNKEQPVEIEGVLTGITSDLLEKLETKHKKVIEKYVVDEKLTIKRYQEKPDVSATKILLYVKDPNETNSENEWKKNPTGIDNAIGNLFPEPIQVQAMENAEEDISKSKSGTTIGKLIGEIIRPIEEKYSGEVKEQMKGLKKILEADGEERAQELKDFDEGANKKLKDFFPSIDIKIHIPTPELKEFFKSGTIKVYEDQQHSEGKDIVSLGTGAQRSIQLALIRYLAEIKKDDESLSRTILLIDEPELYLHPQAIEQLRHALKTLANDSYQIIFATHSAQFITSKDINNAILTRKSAEKGTFPRKRLKDAITEQLPDALSQIELMFALSNSNQILFSEKVILTEGATEQRLLPFIFEYLTGNTLGFDKIALIKQGGVGNTKKSMDVINLMDIPVKSIVDLDFAFVNCIKDGLLSSDDKDISECKNVFTKMNEEGKVNLNNGLPCKGGELTVQEAYKELAQYDEVAENIQSLHEKLKQQNIWLWKKGAIEDYLGISGKGERVWAQYINKFEEDIPENIITEYEEIKNLIEWIKN